MTSIIELQDQAVNLYYELDLENTLVTRMNEVLEGNKPDLSDDLIIYCSFETTCESLQDSDEITKDLLESRIIDNLLLNYVWNA